MQTQTLKQYVEELLRRSCDGTQADLAEVRPPILTEYQQKRMKEWRSLPPGQNRQVIEEKNDHGFVRRTSDERLRRGPDGIWCYTMMSHHRDPYFDSELGSEMRGNGHSYVPLSHHQDPYFAERIGSESVGGPGYVSLTYHRVDPNER